MSLVRSLLFLIVLGFPGLAWAQVGCVPNPNLNGPPFTDGCPVPAAGLNKITSVLSNNVVTAGADPTGVADSTAAFTTCLTAAGSMGTCFATGGTFLLSGNLTIPANTTLSCGFSFGEEEDVPANFASVKAIKLAGTATITAGGAGAAIRNCVIYRSGMTFPAADSTLFAGLAIKDNGFSDLQLTDDVIMGFQTCVLITGRRPYIEHVNMDCQGSGSAGVNGAAFELDNTNTDSGFLKDLKVQPLATGNGNCTSSKRGNYGMALNGIDFSVGGIVVQNFSTDYIVGTAEFLGDGTLWADSLSNSCSWGTTTSFQVNNSLHAVRLDVNSTTQGVVFGVGTPTDTGGLSNIGEIFLTQVQHDCITMNFGFVHVGAIYTNAGTNCTRYGIEFSSTSTQAYLVVDAANIFAANGGVAPYINSDSSPAINIPNFLEITHLRTDLAAGVNPYSSSILWGSGAERQLAGLTTSVGSCTGLGSGGTCALTPGSDALQGAIVLSPAGSPSSSGSITLTFPVAALNNWVCVASNNLDSQQINMSLGYPIITGVDSTHQAIGWAQSGNLTAGQTYAMTYHCRPM